MENLLRCIYVSYAVETPSEAFLETQLVRFRQANALHHITGLLLYHQRAYMQLIEGAPGKIEQLLANIHADTDHYGVIDLLREPATQRMFPDWQMGFRRLSDDALPTGFTDLMAFSKATVETKQLPPQVWALFCSFLGS